MADDGLQFDKAEYAGDGAAAPQAGPACGFCGAPLVTTYHAVADRAACGACREQVVEALTGGSPGLRFARAVALGLLASALGAALYFGVAAVTGYELGLVAIVVGLMVGWAVRKGSDGRGGWVYQGLAVVLAYLTVVSTYVPTIAKVIEFSSRHEGAQPTREALQAVDPSLAAWVLAIPLALQYPYLSGVQNIMGTIILAIALFEAWRMNRRVEVPISGPHPVAPPA
ncbi:MAG: hypothetical protein M9894_35515 [Planctomycetes bacterium]|nr:hypothetical protein [Planctomycetota bacterium]